MRSEIVDKATNRLFELVDATKPFIFGDDVEQVPENGVRLKASLALVKLQREIAKENPADPEGAYVDTFWQDWYKQEHGTAPTAEELSKFKSNHVTVEATEIQERLFSSTPIKRKVSFDPADFLDED